MVALPEGHADPLVFAGPWLSEARLLLLAMAPLGLLGWPFLGWWRRVSPLTAKLAELNQNLSMQALAAMDISIWSNSEVTAELARERGLDSAWIGNGQPRPYPERPPHKPVDVVWLQDNRWASLSAPLAERVTGRAVRGIEAVDHSEMLRRLGEAKVLLYPGRLEGEPRITREARAMGAVPVVVADANPISTKMTEDHGVLPVASEDLIPDACERLLAEPDRLAALAARGVATAREETSWIGYVRRVSRALESLPAAGVAAGARAGFGARIRDQLEDLAQTTASSGELEAELGRVLLRKDECEAEIEQLRQTGAEIEAELARVRERKDECEAELAEARGRLEQLRNQRTVRWAMGTSDSVQRWLSR